MRFALDIGGTSVKCAVVDDDGTVVREGSFDTDASLNNDAFADLLIINSRDFLSEKNEGVISLGAGMAGFCDGKRGIIYESPNLPNIRNFDLSRRVGEGLGLPAYVDNDASAAAWGEFLFGGHDVKDLLVVTLGTGIGGGLVLDGNLYRGARGFGGEIGQMPLYPDGPECPSGGKGCLESYIGRYAVEEDYRKRAGLDRAVEPRIIYKNAMDGDTAAIETWRSYGQRLGVILASAANLLDLGAIALTGGIIGAWDAFTPSLLESFKTYTITPLKNSVEIRRSGLEGRSGLLGAAFLDKA